MELNIIAIIVLLLVITLSLHFEIRNISKKIDELLKKKP
jgi:hypothetical protein